MTVMSIECVDTLEDVKKAYEELDSFVAKGKGIDDRIIRLWTLALCGG